MEFFKNFLLVLGCLLLIASLWPIRRLILPLPLGRTRSFWNVLQYLVCLFVCGYLIYTSVFWGIYKGIADLIVPVIFFFGAVFVFLVCSLSLKTAQDLKRIYVLERENTMDSLMGIYNRRLFDRRLQEEFSRSVRYGQPLSLIMVDIDHFKNVNDRWGHQIGDLVLKRLAELLKGCVRDADIICRYGGEELAIILPHTPILTALQLGERLREKTEKTEILTEDASPDNQSVRITVSMGVATLVPEMESVETLMSQADKALYFAKKNGRNRVVSCSELENNEKCND
jgi:diguanylate cyclase (GGDEF)-like protein